MDRKAFTLMQIMIVVAILALLAAIAVPNFVNMGQKADANFCVRTLQTLDAAKGQWALKNMKKSGDVCGLNDLKGFLVQDPTLYVCPSGGRYVVGVVGVDPTCNLGGEHRIERRDV